MRAWLRGWRRRTAPMLLGAAWSASPGRSAMCIGIVLVHALFPAAVMVAAGQVVGAIPAAVGGGLESPGGRRLVARLAALAVVIVLQQVVARVVSVVLADLSRRVDHHLRTRLIDALAAPVGIAHLDDPKTMDHVATARRMGASWGTPGQGVVGYAGLTAWRLSSFGALLLVARFRWWAALLILVASPIIRHFFYRDIMRTQQVRMGNVRGIRRAQYFRDLALQPPAAKELRVFGFGGWLRERYAQEWDAAIQVVWAARRGNRSTRLATVAVMAVPYGSAFAAVAVAAARRQLSLAELAVLVQAVGATIGLAAVTGQADRAIAQGVVSLPGLFAIEAAVRGARGRSAQTPLSTGEPRCREAVRFEGVRFAYPGAERTVFDRLDLVIRAGQSVALVGANGVGKTTIVKLLTRLYEPDAGRITIDGVDLRDVDPEAWRRQVAVIFQDFFRYELSARDNVGFGAVDVEATDAALDRAAGRAGLDAVVARWPRRWDTPLTPRQRGGVDLSGGEWQRVALARALFAVEQGATVLILDEPTAALDVRGEAELYDRFLEITRGLTTIVISHRFSTVRRADRICVLDGDRVLEDGAHDDLVARGGSYARLFDMQASRFGNGDADA